MFAKSSSKKGAMQLSVGTIVVIVLAMSALVLGIFLTQKIFSTGTNAIDQVDKQVQDQINQLFSDEDKRVATYPQSRLVSIEKGETGGFAFSISNKKNEEETFSYEITASPGNNCQLTSEEAMNLITLGASGEGITLASGSAMNEPEFVRFEISETAPLCVVRYRVDITDSAGDSYSSASKDVEIVSGGGLF